MKNLTHYILKFLTLPICGGISFAAYLLIYPLLQGSETIFGTNIWPEFMWLCIFGGVLSVIFGWPLLALIEWKFYRHRRRYVMGGILCSSLIWLLLAGLSFLGGGSGARGGVYSVHNSFFTDWINRWYPL